MKTIALVLLVILAGLVGFIAARPSEFLIVRSRTLAAPPEVVHAYVNDFHKWIEWSPWEKVDPALIREYSGAPVGAGASYHWLGNDQVGEGRMTITESRAPESVIIRLEFLKPFQATNTAEFFIMHGGLGTEVTWSMTGHNSFMAKAFGLFVNLDKQVGGDFETGLAELDAVTVAATPPPPPALPPAPEPPAEPPAPPAP